jgi:hypothetical protein
MSIINPYRFAKGGASTAEWSFQESREDTSNASVYTFSSVDIGAADADRCVVVAVYARKGGGATSISSVTIGGVTATSIITQGRTDTDLGAPATNIVGFFCADVTSGTSADVVVTYADTMARAACDIWRFVGYDFTSIHDSSGSTADDPTYDIDIPADGVALGAVCAADLLSGAPNWDWTNLTEDSDRTVETFFSASAASQEYASAQTNLTVTAAESNAAREECGVFFSVGLA